MMDQFTNKNGISRLLSKIKTYIDNIKRHQDAEISSIYDILTMRTFVAQWGTTTHQELIDTGLLNTGWLERPIPFTDGHLISGFITGVLEVEEGYIQVLTVTFDNSRVRTQDMAIDIFDPSMTVVDITGSEWVYEDKSTVITDRIIAAQLDGYWNYRIYPDNTFEAWYNRTGMNFDIKYTSGNFYRSDPVTFALPSALETGTVLNVQAQIFHASFPVFGAVSSLNPVKVQALSGANRGSSACNVVIYVFGIL